MGVWLKDAWQWVQQNLTMDVLGLGDGERGARWQMIHDPRLLGALQRVPRAAFIDPPLQDRADEDIPLPIGEGQTISQPFVVALMTQALNPRAGEKILEVGTGSGYQTALLCELTQQREEQPGHSVYSIERFPRLQRRAASVLATLGYVPQLRLGDGAAGWPDEAPFDGILVTAAPWCLPRPLWEQLRTGGRIVIPIGPEDGAQTLWLLHKEENKLRQEELGLVRFVPLVSPLLETPSHCIDF
jgi:protein-L-isoaspartate(D-aspartate) O-methyltransferase